MPDEFGGIAVDEPAQDEFGGVAVQEGKPVDQLAPEASDTLLKGMTPYQRTDYESMKQGGTRPDMGMYTAPGSPASGTPAWDEAMQTYPYFQGIVKEPLKAGMKVIGAVADPLRNVASEFIRKTGIDPTSTPEKLVNFPKLETPEGTTRGKVGEFVAGAGNTASDIASSMLGPELLAAPYKLGQAAYAGSAIAALPESVGRVVEAETPGELGSAITETAANALLAREFGKRVGRAKQRVEERRFEQAKPARVTPSEQTAEPAETVPGTSMPAEPIKTPVDIAPVKPADTSGLSEAVRTFQTQLEDPEFVANNKHSAAAGMGLKSVADLDALAEMDAKQKADLKQRLAEADRTGDMSALMRNMAKPQLPREVIETATKTGSWENDEPALGVTGDRPLDWRKNPEVAEWLRKNGARIGIVLPEELKSHATPSVTPKVTEAGKPAATAPKAPLAPLIDVPKSPKGVAAERQQIIRMLGELEETNRETGVPYPKEGQEERVKKLRQRLAVIEKGLLPPKPVSPTAPTVPPKAPIVSQTPPIVEQTPPIVSPGEPIVSKPPPTPAPAPVTPPAPATPTPTVEVPAQQKAGFDAKQAKAKKKFLLTELDKASEQAPELPTVEADADAAIVDKLRQYQAGDTAETFDAKRNAQLPALFDKYQIPESNRFNEITPINVRIERLDRAIARARMSQLPKVTIQVPGDGEFTIVNSRAAMEAFREHAKDFPTTAPKSTKPSTARTSESKPATLGKLTEESALKAAGLAVSDDPSRFVLHYVWSDGKTTVATDGRHLILIKRGAGGTKAKPLIQTVEGKAAPEIISGEKANEATPIKYPEWRQVVPSELPPVAKDVDAARLFTILKQAEQVLTDRSNSVTLFVNPDGSVGATSRSPDVGEYEHNIQEGAKVIGAFNPQYVMDGLNAARMVGDEKVSIESSDDLSPLVIRSRNTQTVIMPMRLSDIDPTVADTGLEEMADYTEIGHDNETAQNMQARPGANPSTGLPSGVPDRGPRFASELLEASRQLDALVRYRGTLRPGVLGQVVRARSAIGHNDKIEVGDIQNQGTVAHEIGHALDATLWPDIFASTSRGSQRSIYERAKTGTAKELRADLVKVSEIMRGPITGSKGHIAYRRSATELIADFASLYMHDPAQAAALAPKFAQGFENALARVPDAHGVIVQLHGEGIEPEAPGGRAGPAAVPTATAGAVPAKEVAAPITRDVPLVMAAEDLVKGEVRQFEAEQQRARVKADSWRKRLPDRGDREDVGAFVEGIGNVTLPGDTIANVQSRMTPEMKALAKDFRFDIELQRQRINQYLKFLDQGDYLKFLEDYLPHFYANGKAAVTSALGRFIKESPNAKRRTLPTLQEAVEYGLVPITQDPAVLYEHTARINWRVATNRKMLGKLKELKTTSGEPVVVPAKDAPPSWPISNNPLIQQTYAHPTDSGAMVIWKGGAAIHPDAFRAVRQMLDTPVSSDLGKAYDALNGFTRANAFAFSLFHDITLRSASGGALMRWYNPARGLFRLFERNPVTGELQVFRSTRSVGKDLLQDEASVADAAQHGLKFSWTESESYQKNARDFLEKAAARWRETPFLGRSAALARDIQHMRQQGLWKNTHDAYKIIAYNDLTAKALQGAPPGTSAKAVKEAIASLLNDAFGGQEWQTKFWMSPQTRLMMSRFFLAPDWTLSTLRSVPGVSDVASAVRGQAGRLTGPMPTSKEGVRGNLGRARFWGGEIAALAMATIAAQYAIYQMFGDKKKGDKPWIWENETEQQRRVDATPLMRKLPWHKANDPTRYYINLGKRPEEILGWVIHPEQNTLSKMARPVAEVFRQVTGTEGDFKAQWKRDHESFLESLPARGKSIIGQAVPFTLSGNQFAMALPYRKGMTRYKAQQAYESAYELIAEPNRFRAFLRGHNVGGQPQRGVVEQTPQTLLGLVTDAAKRNGVPAGEVQAQAASIVRGKYYGEYFKALKSGDKKALTNAAEALQRLGATFEGVQKSMEKRQTMEPIPAK